MVEPSPEYDHVNEGASPRFLRHFTNTLPTLTSASEGGSADALVSGESRSKALDPTAIPLVKLRAEEVEPLAPQRPSS